MGFILFNNPNLDNDADYKIDKPKQPVGDKRTPISEKGYKTTSIIEIEKEASCRADKHGHRYERQGPYINDPEWLLCLCLRFAVADTLPNGKDNAPNGHQNQSHSCGHGPSLLIPYPHGRNDPYLSPIFTNDTPFRVIVPKITVAVLPTGL